MIERTIYVLIALALAGLAWLSVGWTQGHYADLMRYGGPGHWLQWSTLVSGVLLAVSFVLAAAAGFAGLFFLFISWAMDAPGDSLKDPQWCELLFREHPKRQLREWARSMRYFRFIRGSGGGMDDHGDRLAVGLKADYGKDIQRILTALAASDPAAPLSRSSDFVRVRGVKVDIHDSGGKLELSIRDSEQDWEVTQAAVDAARSVETLLEPLVDMLIEPPQDDRHCVCPKYYPSFWHEEKAAALPTPTAREDHTRSERVRNLAFLMVCLGAGLLFLAAMAWRELSDEALVQSQSGNSVFAYLHDIGGAPLAVGAFLVPAVYFLFHARHVVRELKREHRRSRKRRREKID